MTRRVASVPFVNARPLALWFEREPSAGVEVTYDLPSRLPALLDSGAAEAVLASSYEALSTPGRRVAEGVGIVSRGAARSVRLLSRVPVAQISSLALDAASMTSNALAQALLIERCGVRPRTEPMPAHVASMLAKHDACVVIGDAGLEASAQGLHEWDLGCEWTNLTGYPFVWALWIGGSRLDADLVARLNRALAWARGNWDAVLADAQARSGWSLEVCRTYLSEVMFYEVGPAERAGLEEFGRLLAKHGLSPGYEPEWIASVEHRTQFA